MLIKILVKMKFSKVFIAGFDGYVADDNQNYPEEYIQFLFCNDNVVLRNEAVKSTRGNRKGYRTEFYNPFSLLTIVKCLLTRLMKRKMTANKRLNIRAVALDLDGVVYEGDHVIEGAADTIGTLRDKGIEIYFVTNNSGRKRTSIAEKLNQMGIDAPSIRSSHPDTPPQFWLAAYALQRIIEFAS